MFWGILGCPGGNQTDRTRGPNGNRTETTRYLPSPAAMSIDGEIKKKSSREITENDQNKTRKRYPPMYIYSLCTTKTSLLNRPLRLDSQWFCMKLEYCIYISTAFRKFLEFRTENNSTCLRLAYLRCLFTWRTVLIQFSCWQVVSPKLNKKEVQ